MSYTNDDALREVEILQLWEESWCRIFNPFWWMQICGFHE